MAELQKFAKKGETQKKCNMGRPRGDRRQKLVLASRSPKIAENQHFSNFSLPAGRDMFSPLTDWIQSCSGHSWLIIWQKQPKWWFLGRFCKHHKFGPTGCKDRPMTLSITLVTLSHDAATSQQIKKKCPKKSHLKCLKMLRASLLKRSKHSKRSKSFEYSKSSKCSRLLKTLKVPKATSPWPPWPDLEI